MTAGYQDHDRRVWERIFRDVPHDWFQAPPSGAMEACLEFLRGSGPRRTVDVGCGIGRWSMFMTRNGVAPVIGIDYSPTGVDVARRWAERESVESVRFLAGDVLRLPFVDAAFDAVIAALLLDNLDRRDARLAVDEIGRVATPGAAGFFVFNPWLGPERIAELEVSDNPTRDCMHVVYEDDELERLVSGWRVTRRMQSVEGLRILEAIRGGAPG